MGKFNIDSHHRLSRDAHRRLRGAVTEVGALAEYLGHEIGFYKNVIAKPSVIQLFSILSSESFIFYI